MIKTTTAKNEHGGQRPGFPWWLHIGAVLMLGFFWLSGCATWPRPTRSGHAGAPGSLGACADFFASLDRQVTIADVSDPGYTRVRGYPYLRTNRFIASFRDETAAPPAFAAWVDQMQALDQAARESEITNLPAENIAAMAPHDNRNELFHRVVACGNLLKQIDFSQSGKRENLRHTVMAQDDYILLHRVLGLYPITRLFISRGVRQWHAQARKHFSLEPPDWLARSYSPAAKSDASQVRRILQQPPRDALGIPVYTHEDCKSIFDFFSPIWVIQNKGRDDLYGALVWRNDGRLDVDTNHPHTYIQLSFSRFGKAVLTQLNYIIWFPSRPKTGALDIYGGLLDGITYRVTLDTKGEPILYETIHNCGCYYMAYPTARLRTREPVSYAEPPLILTAPDIDPAGQRMAVAVTGRTHEVRHFYPLPREAPSGKATYTLVDYDQLKHLGQADGTRRSMFNRYGIVPESRRLERFILWPTGVLSPGAMRQWGKHAVAFVGRRHFDDPFYLDKMFVAVEPR